MIGLEQFDVLTQVDLADISADPTTIYKLFNNLWRKEFNNNQRIVFYTADRPHEELIKHVERAAQIIDISEYFILICCPFKLSTSLQSMVVDVKESGVIKNNYKIPDSICPLPWSHLEVDISGDYKPCCVYSGTTGKSVRDTTINEAFTSDSMNTLRKEFLLGNQPAGCSHCWRIEEKNLTSNRIMHMNFLQKELFVEYLDDAKLRSIDIKSGNTCNFTCRICGPDRSSLIADEVMRAYPEKTIEIKNMLLKNKWADSTTSFFIDLENALPDLVNINMVGGEPFLVKQFDRILELAVEHGYSQQIRLHYNSNGSIFPNKQVAVWSKFRQIDLALSIDNIGDRFELERGGAWVKVESNIKQFLKLDLPNLNIYIMPTVNIQNVYYIPELLEWATPLGLKVVFNYLDYPPEFNINYLTKDCKRLVVEKYKKYTHTELAAIAKRVEECEGSDGSMFVNKMSRFDTLRGQSFKETHPEVAKAMGYSI